MIQASVVKAIYYHTLFTRDIQAYTFESGIRVHEIFEIFESADASFVPFRVGAFSEIITCSI
jgi:hypothetical protein